MDKYPKYGTRKEFHIPKTMKAVTLSGVGFENVDVREVPVPEVGANQLLCRVDAAGVCTSILKLIAQGSAHTFLNGWDPKEFPIILGDEGSVTVVKAGESLSKKYESGQRFGIQPAVDITPINHRERYHNNAEGMKKCAVGYSLPGNLAQYILIQEEVLEGSCLIPLPDDTLPCFAVSMAEPISCVYSSQERHFHIEKKSPFAQRVAKLGILTGGTTVVIGAGSMGRMHVELAMRFHPQNLIVCDPIADRLEQIATTLGEKARRSEIELTLVTPDKLKDTLHTVSKGAGADDLILAVGIQSVQQGALELLGKGGVVNLFGGLPRGNNILEVDAIAVHYDEIKLVGSSGGEPSDLKSTLEVIAHNDIDPGNYVCGIGSLRHVPEVLRMIQDNKLDGKVIIYPHIDIEDLMMVDYWNEEREKQYLTKHS